MIELARNSRDVCVVGFGAATAVGSTAPASAAAVRAGVAMFVDHPYMIDQDDEPLVVAMAPYLDDGHTCEERFGQLVLLAASEALEPLATLPPSRSGRIPAAVGLPAPRPGLPTGLDSELRSRLSEAHGNIGRNLETQSLPNGHSAGLMAIEAGCQLIRQGAAEFALVGGADCYLDDDTLEWIENSDRLHKTTNAWGFVPGEAAAFCVLSLRETAHRYGLPVLGWLQAIATTYEANRIHTKTVCIGKGLSQAVNQVLEQMPLERPIIDYTICDQNGEAYRADEFGFMLARTCECFADTSDFLAPADCWGDVGAASGPLFVALASIAGQKGYARGPHTLLWSSSEGGERSAAIIHTDLATASAH